MKQHASIVQISENDNVSLFSLPTRPQGGVGNVGGGIDLYRRRSLQGNVDNWAAFYTTAVAGR